MTAAPNPGPRRRHSSATSPARAAASKLERYMERTRSSDLAATLGIVTALAVTLGYASGLTPLSFNGVWSYAGQWNPLVGVAIGGLPVMFGSRLYRRLRNRRSKKFLYG